MPILLAAATMAPPEGPLAGQLRGALWHDLQLNGMIYNGSALASLWYNAGGEDENAPQLHIRNMACRANAQGHRCAFTLWREGGARMVRDELAPDTIACTTQFVVRAGQPGEWMVKHRPPTRGPATAARICGAGWRAVEATRYSAMIHAWGIISARSSATGGHRMG